MTLATRIPNETTRANDGGPPPPPPKKNQFIVALRRGFDHRPAAHTTTIRLLDSSQ
jgi:hypothetical protein